jgi:hypothetical protein
MHYQNVLAGEREPWLVTDPKLVRGDAEFGLAPLLWRRLGEAGGPAGLRRRFDALVDEAGLDVELARGWTLLRAVDYQLWGLNLGLTEDPGRCATVNRLALARRQAVTRTACLGLWCPSAEGMSFASKAGCAQGNLLSLAGLAPSLAYPEVPR